MTLTRQQNFLAAALSRAWRRVGLRLNRPDIQSISGLILVIYTVFLALAFATSANGRTVFGPELGADFGAFYVAGKIANTVAPDRIYDRNLQRRFYREIFPMAEEGEELPYVNAPFFAAPLPLLARLPYAWAYLVWLLFSLGLYVAGFTLLWRTLDNLPNEIRWAALLLSLSFMPFLVECLAGGQTSAFGFFSLALAISCERRGRPMMSGAALALCLYKPTLLILILPMLVVTRRFSTMAGFAIGGLFLAVVSLLVVGWEGCVDYVRMLLFFTDASTGAATVLKSWKYVDVNSFFRLLLNNHTYLRWIATGAAFLLVLPLLLRFWRKTSRKSENDQNMVWAFTLTWTLVLNLYVGIYDATLVVLSVLLTTNVFYRQVSNHHCELPPASLQDKKLSKIRSTL